MGSIGIPPPLDGYGPDPVLNKLRNINRTPPPPGMAPPPQVTPPPTPSSTMAPASPTVDASVPGDLNSRFDKVEQSMSEGKNESALSKYPEKMHGDIRRLAGYMVPLTARVQNDPYWRTALTAAGEYDPSFNVGEYANRQKLRQRFEIGPEATSITSLNRAMIHLNNLRKAADSLHNFTGPAALLNYPVNWVEQHADDPRFDAYNTAAEFLAEEIPKALRGTAAEGDIKSWREKFNPYKGPKTQNAVINEAINGLAGQIRELRRQYVGGMGRNPPRWVSPESLGILKQLGHDPAEFGDSPQGPPQAKGQPVNDMIMVQIPGMQPGPIHASQRERFLADHPGAKVLQ